MESVTFPCYLSDQDGNALDPFAPDSVRYTNLSGTDGCGEQPVLLQTGGILIYTTVAVLMEGYITLCACEGRLLRTVPFRSIQTVLLPFPPGDMLAFRTLGFGCRAKSISVPADLCSNYAEVLVHVESGVRPAVGRDDCPRYTVFKSCIAIPCYMMPLHFSAYQYNAVGDGEKRIFTNADQSREYGCTEIPAPDSISFYRLFVNGVLQPETTYVLKRGRLEFLTEDVPPDGVPVTLLFVDLGPRKSRRARVETGYYVTASDGVRSRYTDEDEWKIYGCGGIPDPQELSCWNLFINGVLQPQATYEMKKGSLRLCEPPPKGQAIVLEFMRVLDAPGRLLKGLVSQYVAFARGNRLFTDRDAAKIYDSARIMLPLFSSYQSLFVNGVIQPASVYRVGACGLSFVSADPPDIGQPVTQQSTSIFR